MSGHSKWASIKHKKGALDAKRGQLFSKLIREITVAAKNGGGNPDTNIRLRVAISAAKNANMPGDNVEKAVLRGTGQLPGVTYEEVTYEGYAPNGIAVIVEVLSDNKNRTSAEIRNIFSKKGGNLSGAGSVAWQFSRKGFISVDKSSAPEDKVFNTAIEAGADDFKAESDCYEIITSTESFEAVKDAITKADIKISSSELTSMASNNIKITDEETARKILELVELLEEHDDVQHVYANFDIPDEIIQKVAASG
jgi:YebC/PmpR family DNA-binding regulatory protein